MMMMEMLSLVIELLVRVEVRFLFVAKERKKVFNLNFLNKKINLLVN